jgi:glutaredoxin
VWKKAQMLKPPAGYVGRAKTLGKCHYCNEMFAASHLEVDHVQQAGTCNSWETAQQFLYNLLDTNDNWVLACRPCHKVKSLAEKTGMTFEQAQLEKQIIEICKRETTEVLAFLAEKGYTGVSVSNAAKRRKLVEKILKDG